MVFISKIREMSLQRFPVLGERAHTSTAAAVFLYVSTTGNVIFLIAGLGKVVPILKTKVLKKKKEKEDVGLLGLPPLKHSRPRDRPPQPPFPPSVTSEYIKIYIKCAFSFNFKHESVFLAQRLNSPRVPNGSLYSLKTRTPDIWGISYNKHLSIVLCDWPVGLPSSW